MATVAEAAGHICLTSARFQELLSSGVISKAERGAYDLDAVRKEYILNLRKKASGRGDGDGLTEARAELAREQRDQIALKNAVSRGEYAPLSIIMKGVETIFATFRERCLAVPGKVAMSCEMRTRGEVEDILRAEIYEALDELARPVVDAAGLSGDSDSAGEGASGGQTAAASEPD